MSKKLRGLPKRITVGWRTFKVAGFDNASKAEYSGQADVVAGELRFNLNHDDQFLAQILLHELIHSIFQVYTDNEGVSEGMVDALASGLQTLWRDNPELIKWLDHRIKG